MPRRRTFLQGLLGAGAALVAAGPVLHANAKEPTADVAADTVAVPVGAEQAMIAIDPRVPCFQPKVCPNCGASTLYYQFDVAYIQDVLYCGTCRHWAIGTAWDQDFRRSLWLDDDAAGSGLLNLDRWRDEADLERLGAFFAGTDVKTDLVLKDRGRYYVAAHLGTFPRDEMVDFYRIALTDHDARGEFIGAVPAFGPVAGAASLAEWVRHQVRSLEATDG